MQFNFHERSVESHKKSTFDVMSEAANGKSLPGRWGLIQVLCNVWATSPPESTMQKALWATKACLSTVSVWRAYREDKNPMSLAKTDPFVEFCTKAKLDRPSPISHMSDLILEASKNRIPYEDHNLRGEKDYIVRKFIPPQGPPYYFKLYISPDKLICHPCEGPIFAKGFEDSGLAAIRDVLWTQFKSQAIRLSICTVPHPTYDLHTVLDLTDAGSPDPYIFDKSSEDWVNATTYAQRCRAFMSRGLVRGVLFYGPPGTGKTSLAMSLLGDAGRILKITAAAIQHADFYHIARLILVLDPRVILFDDIDRFGRSDLTAMLEYMEGLKKSPPQAGRIIVGTVNAIEAIDPALLRSGRFDEVLFVPEPSVEQRLALIHHYIKFFGAAEAEFDVASMAVQMDGFSPADIRSVIESVTCVGTEYLTAEIDRTRRQRRMSTDDKILHYLKDKPVEAPPPSLRSHY